MSIELGFSIGKFEGYRPPADKAIHASSELDSRGRNADSILQTMFNHDNKISVGSGPVHLV